MAAVSLVVTISPVYLCLGISNPIVMNLTYDGRRVLGRNDKSCLPLPRASAFSVVMNLVHVRWDTPFVMTLFWMLMNLIYKQSKYQRYLEAACKSDR